MDAAAAVAWGATAGGGLFMLGKWLAKGGLGAQRAGATRLRAGLVFSHLGLAAVGLVLWLAHLVTGGTIYGWLAFAVLPFVAGLGLAMFLGWLGGRGAHAGLAETDPPPEQTFPVLVVALHGAAAVVTLVLVFLGAAGIAD